MIKLLEDEIILKVRKEDESFVEAMIPEIEEKYQTIMKKNTDRDY